MTLNRKFLNNLLDEEVFREPRNEQFIKDLCTVIGGDCNPQLKADDFSQAAFRVAAQVLKNHNDVSWYIELLTEEES